MSGQIYSKIKSALVVLRANPMRANSISDRAAFARRARLGLAFFGCLAAISILWLTTNSTGYAADKAAKSALPSPIQLLHKPISERTLPLPGQPVTLSLELSGTREISLPVRLVAVRDGRLLPVPLKNSYRNAAERPVYDFVVEAPLAELTYQFLLPLPAANSDPRSILSTPRTVVRRPCIPALDASASGNANRTELENLAITARVLEQEIDAYNAALAAVEVLKKEVVE